MNVLFDFYWLMFSIIVLITTGITFFWALKKGLFKDQERARYLPLWAEVREEEKNEKNKP